MSEPQLAAVVEVAAEEQQRRQWSQDTELLAAAVELLRHIAARLDGGVTTALVKDIEDQPELEPIPRPDWIQAPEDLPAPRSGGSGGGGELVVTPREFATRFAPRR